MSGNGNKGNGNKNKKPANIKIPKEPREAHWAETQATPSPGGTYYTYRNTPVIGTPKNNGNKKRKSRKTRKTRKAQKTRRASRANRK